MKQAVMMRAVGEMPEWPNGTDSKSVVPSPVPRVRIPISPPLFKKPCNSMSYGAFCFPILLLVSTTPAPNFIWASCTFPRKSFQYPFLDPCAFQGGTMMPKSEGAG